MDNNFAGVGLIVLGMFFFSIQDILIKLIIVDTSLLQILVFRAVAGCILLIIFLLYTKRTITLGSAYPKIAITRGLLFFFGFMLFYISISKINLAEATSLFFVSPFFMTIFSKLILKNYIGLNRIFSLLVGFSGTLLIIKPEFNNVNIYMLLPILCAFTYALSMTLAKKTSDKDNLFQQTFHIYLGAIVIGILIHVILNSLNLNYNPDGLTLLTKTWIVDDLTILFMIFFISIIGSLGIISLINKLASQNMNFRFFNLFSSAFFRDLTILPYLISRPIKYLLGLFNASSVNSSPSPQPTSREVFLSFVKFLRLDAKDISIRYFGYLFILKFIKNFSNCRDYDFFRYLSYIKAIFLFY